MLLQMAVGYKKVYKESGFYQKPSVLLRAFSEKCIYSLLDTLNSKELASFFDVVLPLQAKGEWAEWNISV